MRIIFLSMLLLFPLYAHAIPAVPNDCWSGVMAADKAAHGEMVATGPVAQWRVGLSLVLYPTKETADQIWAMAQKGETPTYDTSRPITLTPTQIFGPEPGDKDNPDEAKEIEVTLSYRTYHGETGSVLLTLWTPMNSPSPPDQQATMDQFNQQSHDTVCRGIP